MSCKVLTGTDPVEVSPVVWPTIETGGKLALSERHPTNISSADEKEPAGQVDELHGRIVELERALQRDVRQSHESGLREGERRGKESAQAELQPVVERMSRAIGDLASVRTRIRRETESDLVTLAIAIARRVLHRELAVDPEAIQGLVKAALEKVQSRDICRVRIHPDHHPHVRGYLERSGMPPGLEVIADPSLHCGDLLIETKRGDLDASIDTQLREIERGFADRIKS
jgi:flagellar assembly protein FliH